MPLLHQMDITLLGKNFRNIYNLYIFLSLYCKKKNLKNDMKFAQDEEPVLLLLLN